MDPLTFALLAVAAAVTTDALTEDPMAYLLAPPGEHPAIGAEETTSFQHSGIARLDSPHGSTRYLMLEEGIPISALQVVSRDGKSATIANVYTQPSHRREGLALKLLQRARSDFQQVEHSPDLTRDGESWADATDAIAEPLGRPGHRFEYWASCPDLTGPIIHHITDNARHKKVSYRTFASRVDLEPLRHANHPAMYRISSPSNWSIKFFRSELPSGRPVYYFKWSGIEHIFVDPERGMPDREKEDRAAKREFQIEDQAHNKAKFDDLSWKFQQAMAMYRYGIEAHELTAEAAKLGMPPLLGAGSSRAVFDIGHGRVLKISFNEKNPEQNLAEARAWKTAPLHVRKHLVPVVQADPEGQWLIMEKAEPMDPRDLMDPQLVQRLKDFGIQDLSPSNFTSDGRILDYGWRIR